MSSLGKTFEKYFKEQVKEQIPDAFVFRLYDIMDYRGISNPCDFFVFLRPSLIMCELKSCSGASMSHKNISDYQLQSMTEASKIRGLKAYTIIWFYEKSICLMFKTKYLYKLFIEKGKKSVSYKDPNGIEVPVIKALKKYNIWDWSVLKKVR